MFFFAHADVRKDSYVYFRAHLTMRLVSPKRIAAIAVTVAVIAIVFMQSFAVLQLNHKLRQIKWAMKTKVIQSQSSGDLQTFSFSHSEWKALFKPDPTEFVFQGHYYDIAYVQNDGSGIVVKCLKDEKETFVKKQLRAWMDQEDSPYSKTKEKGNVYKVLSKVLLPLASKDVMMSSNAPPVCFFKAFDYSFIFSFQQFRPPIG
jgi:hypothetical protein